MPDKRCSAAATPGLWTAGAMRGEERMEAAVAPGGKGALLPERSRTLTKLSQPANPRAMQRAGRSVRGPVREQSRRVGSWLTP